jgi:hypothetical protein
MIEKEKIKSWQPPIWHKDFGDAPKELSLLKDLCLKIIEIDESCLLELDCFEEGYMTVVVNRTDKPYFEIQVVDLEDKRIGLFFENGSEFYIRDFNEIVVYLK